MKEKIATIKLARGNVGFYDKLTKIYLNMSAPLADVYAGMNTTNLKRAVKFRTIELVSGSLNAPRVVVEDKVKEEISEPKEEIKEKEPELKEKVVEEEKAEEKEEKEIKEESPKKTATKKKKTSASKKQSSTEDAE